LQEKNALIIPDGCKSNQTSEASGIYFVALAAAICNKWLSPTVFIKMKNDLCKLQMGRELVERVKQSAICSSRGRKQLQMLRHLFSFSDKSQWLISFYDDECTVGIKENVVEICKWSNVLKASSNFPFSN
jgi:hypothetical protein